LERLVVYFALAIAFHVRARDFAQLGMPLLLEGLALAALWIGLGTP
jgi:hypothetical protein